MYLYPTLSQVRFVVIRVPRVGFSGEEGWNKLLFSGWEGGKSCYFVVPSQYSVM